MAVPIPSKRESRTNCRALSMPLQLPGWCGCSGAPSGCSSLARPNWESRLLLVCLLLPRPPPSA
eukprot:9289193-Heterocapsa_arctica.AAC.1